MAYFCATFLSLVILFAVLTSTPWADRVLHQPLSRLLAIASVPFLSIAGSAWSSGTQLHFEGFSAVVEEACNGVLPTYIYIAAVLAFPSRWVEKAWGILIGIPTIFVVNLVRVITLMFFGAYWPDLFEKVHIYVWQALVVGLSMAIWLFWVERFVRPRARERA
jgi:exosortase H (IPTLxxWG-CTERM-specific)